MDAKHVQKLGVRMALYILLLKWANWETGKILFYRDIDAAEKFELPIRKIRDWRRRLEDDGYISCLQKSNHQEITIHKWQDPREKEPINPIVNDNEGYEKPVPLSYENTVPLPKNDTEGYIEGGIKSVTLPYIKNIRNKNKDIDTLDEAFNTMRIALFSDTLSPSWWKIMENAPKLLDGDVLKIFVDNSRMVADVNSKTKNYQKNVATCGLPFKSFILEEVK